MKPPDPYSDYKLEQWIGNLLRIGVFLAAAVVVLFGVSVVIFLTLKLIPGDAAYVLAGPNASAQEIEAVRQFLRREGTCLILAPHHDVGVSTDVKQRAMEYAHHGDPLVPRQQRFGRYTRSLMKGLGLPVENRYGLRPATIAGTNRLVPLSTAKDLDTRAWLDGVATFNFHRHLPHYAVTTDDGLAVRVLATQPIDLSRPHPFTEAGNREFNSFVWLPPAAKRAGEILLADSTVFSTLFGADDSLRRFWKNLATAT